MNGTIQYSTQTMDYLGVWIFNTLVIHSLLSCHEVDLDMSTNTSQLQLNKLHPLMEKMRDGWKAPQKCDVMLILMDATHSREYDGNGTTVKPLVKHNTHHGLFNCALSLSR